jgi:hypothetical protein
MTNSAVASPIVSSKANTPQLMHESSSKSNQGGHRNSAPYNSGSMEMNQNETRSSSRVASAAPTGAASPAVPSGSSSRKPSASRDRT